VAGVALGVGVFIVTVSMMDGLVVYFTERLIRVSPLLTVQPERLDVTPAREALARAARPELLHLSRPPVPDIRPTVRGAPALAEIIRRSPGIVGAARAASAPAVLSFGTLSEPATVLGLEPAEEATVTALPETVTAGSWQGLLYRREGAVLGAQLADRLGAQVGDRLVAVGETGRQRELEVVAIASTGLGSLDEGTVFVNLALAQGLAGWDGDEASEIRVRTRELVGLEAARRRLEALAGHRVETWEEASRASLQLFRTIGLTAYLLTGFVLVVAGFGIANKLTTIILEKEREIAVLRSVGFSRRAVKGVFLVQGLILGGVGAALGCAAAALAIAYLTVFPIRFTQPEGAVMAYRQLYFANDPRYYAVIAAAALVISAFASLLAVRKAARVPPVEVLRGAV
jgi:lipoprotein-releasing system permease protein